MTNVKKLLAVLAVAGFLTSTTAAFAADTATTDGKPAAEAAWHRGQRHLSGVHQNADDGRQHFSDALHDGSRRSGVAHQNRA